MYKAKCGRIDEEEESPRLAEITCILVGCKGCVHKTEKIYYEKDIKKGLSEWAKSNKK